MDKFSCISNKRLMELGSRSLDSLRIKTQVLERCYCVSTADGAATPCRME